MLERQLRIWNLLGWKLHFVTADPAPVTAYGVYVGMQACANERWGSDSLSNKI